VFNKLLFPSKLDANLAFNDIGFKCSKFFDSTSSKTTETCKNSSNSETLTFEIDKFGEMKKFSRKDHSGKLIQITEYEEEKFLSSYFLNENVETHEWFKKNNNGIGRHRITKKTSKKSFTYELPYSLKDESNGLSCEPPQTLSPSNLNPLLKDLHKIVDKDSTFYLDIKGCEALPGESVRIKNEFKEAME
jgi:hypothetical protein